MKRKLLQLFMLATVLGSFLGTTNGVLAQKPVSTTQATARTLTQQIASLEVKRALLDVTYTPDSPVVQDVERNLRSLRQRLVQLQLNGSQLAVSQATKKAIRAKIAQLETERAQQSTRYSSDSPIIQHLNSQLRSLQKRLQR